MLQSISLMLRHQSCHRRRAAGKMRLVNGNLVRSGVDVYLVMEHCGGGDLHELRGQLTASQIRGLMHQLLSAVQYMHGLNVWHRDLKSANVLLTVYEGRHIAKVADLGTAGLACSNCPPPPGRPRRAGRPMTATSACCAHASAGIGALHCCPGCCVPCLQRGHCGRAC